MRSTLAILRRFAVLVGRNPYETGWTGVELLAFSGVVGRVPYWAGWHGICNR